MTSISIRFAAGALWVIFALFWTVPYVWAAESAPRATVREPVKTPKALFLIKRARIEPEAGGPVLYPFDKQMRTILYETVKSR